MLNPSPAQRDTMERLANASSTFGFDVIGQDKFSCAIEVEIGDPWGDTFDVSITAAGGIVTTFIPF